MAIVISSDRNQMFSQMYGTMSDETLGFLTNNIDKLTNTFKNYAGQIPNYIQEVSSRFKKGAVRTANLAKSIINTAKNIFNNNICYLDNTFDFRTCSPINQQYIYANDYFRNEIDSGRLDGWHETRVDNYPDLVGWVNPLNQLATDGLLQYGDEYLDNVERDSNINFYVNYNGDKQLTFTQQLIIKQNCENLYRLINTKEDDEALDSIIDPTSITGKYI